MKRLACLLACLTIAALSTTSMAASSPAPPRSTTIGGGVKRPWTPPYMLAIVTVPEPTTLAVLGIGAAALVVRRRK